MIRGLLCLAVAIAGVWAASAVQADAQSNPFRRMLGQDVERAEPSLWYERADQRGRFIFDRSNQPALLWPEDSEEVFAVYQARASGGGEIWLTDTDKVLLRSTRIGGWTYFPPDYPDGVIVEAVGRARTLVAAPIGPDELQESARDMVNTLGRLARRNVRAELTSLPPDQNPYIADTLSMISLGADKAPRRALRDLEVVRVGVGEAPQVRFDGRTLDISVTPEKGYGGRPSSERIRRTIEVGAR